MAATRGAVAAGHPLTAETGAQVLRDGGNAVDAAVAAVMTSCVTESPLTGLGAGGYMLVHEGDEAEVLDFFVAVPGAGEIERGADLVPIPVYFTPETPQVFHIGAASCGVPGTPAGLVDAVERFGSVPLADLAAPAIRQARDGVVVNGEQAFFLQILDPILTHYDEARELYAPQGSILGEGERFRFPDLGDALERLATEGAEPFYRGDIAAAVSDWVLERGGTLGRADLAAYASVHREPVRASYRGRDILTNPPPSSGGILIAFALALLERMGEEDLEDVVGAMEAAQSARTEDFLTGLRSDGFAERFLDPSTIAATADGVKGRSTPATDSDRPRTSRPSTPMAGARASPARMAPALASSSPVPASTSTTCWARRTSTLTASTGTRSGCGCPR